MKRFIYIIFLLQTNLILVLGQNVLESNVNPFAKNLYILINGGSTYPLTDYNNSQFGYFTDFGLGYFFNSNSRSLLGFELRVSSGTFKGINNYLGFPSNFTTKSINLGSRLNYSYNINETIIPVLALGISYYWMSYTNADYVSKIIHVKSGTSINSLVFDIEPKIKLRLSKLIALNIGLGLHLVNNDNLDAITFGNHNDFFISGIVGFSLSIFSTGDSDGDGILDNIDNCPEKPEDYDGYEDQDGCPDFDNDNDGIADDEDNCPYTQEDLDGFEDLDGCPEIDNDNDGFFDYNDKCPNVSEDFDGFKDDDGCPDYDNDGDNIPDSLDNCPNKPETLNGYLDEDGCPDVKPVKKVIKEIKRNTKEKVRLPNLFLLHSENTFLNETDLIKPSAFSKLDKIYLLLKQYPRAKWRIEGHVDTKENKLNAINISRRQAEAIKDYFVSKGLSKSNFVVMGMGDSMPVAPNKTFYGRLKNRRIKIIRIK